jgi:hypothetical protein
MSIRSFLFGSGKVRLEFTDSEGRKGTIKVPYEGSPDEAELIKHVRAAYAVEYGARIVDYKIIAWMHK